MLVCIVLLKYVGETVSLVEDVVETMLLSHHEQISENIRSRSARDCGWFVLKENMKSPCAGSGLNLFIYEGRRVTA